MESGSCLGIHCPPKKGTSSWATFSPQGPNNRSPPVGMKERRQMKAGKRGWLPWSFPLFSVTHPEENLIKSTYQDPHKREMRTHERKDGEKEKWKEGGNGGVAVMSDASPTVSSVTFRIAKKHWTSGGTMKRGCHTQTQETKDKQYCLQNRALDTRHGSV